MVSDEELVARTLHGDASAFGSLLRRHQRAILGFCRRHVGDLQEAEDLAQEAFLRAYFDLHALREPAKFARWTRAIALRLCQSWHRRRREVPMPAESRLWRDCERQVMVSKTPLETATDVLVREAVTALPDSYQDVIVLRYFEGLTQSEVASLLGIPVETVRTRLRRAKKRLKEAWSAMMEETKRKGEEFARRVLEKLEIVSTESGLVWPLYACMHALGRDWPLAYLMGVTGTAFRATVDDQVSDAGHTSVLDWDRWFAVIPELGCETAVFNAQLKSFSPDIPTNTEEEFRAVQAAAWEAVRVSVDRGIPAIAWMPMTLEQKARGLRCEYGLLIGYDLGAGVYHVRLPWTAVYDVPWDGFGRADPVNWFNVIVFRKERALDERQLVQQALAFAVEHAHSSRPGHGFGAYNVWLGALDKGCIQPDGGARTARLLREARESAADFVTDAAGRFPAATASFLEAAGRYGEEAAAWKAYLQVGDNPEKRRSAVEAALAAEREAVSAVQQALARC